MSQLSRENRFALPPTFCCTRTLNGLGDAHMLESHLLSEVHHLSAHLTQKHPPRQKTCFISYLGIPESGRGDT